MEQGSPTERQASRGLWGPSVPVCLSWGWRRRKLGVCLRESVRTSKQNEH